MYISTRRRRSLSPSPSNNNHNSNNNNDLSLTTTLEKKINLVIEGFNTDKFCEMVLRDRNRLSKENALTICYYVIVMKREIIQGSTTKNVLFNF